MENKEHREIWFSGEVQGVGFRATAVRLANNYDLKGRVKNLNDGRVWLSLEGEAKVIESFLADLQKLMGFYIRSNNEQKSIKLRGWDDFRIEY